MKRFALLLVVVGSLWGCRKDDDVVVCPAPAASLADVSTAAPPVQVFAFDLGQAQSFRTAKGATLAFGASTFRQPDGRPATGPATLRVREIYAPGDMVLADMPTTNFNSILLSGGEFNIQVWQGSTRLLGPAAYVSTGTPQPLALTVPVATAGTDSTRLMQMWAFYPPIGPDSLRAGWQQAGLSPLVTRTQGTVYTHNGSYFAALAFDTLSWWNIDQFWHIYATHPATTVRVAVPAGASETRLYFQPVGYNGLARCYPDNTGGWQGQLPVGVEAIAVVLQARAGQLYYGTQRFTTAANQTITPPLETLSAPEIIRRIRLL